LMTLHRTAVSTKAIQHHITMVKNYLQTLHLNTHTASQRG